ncbi:MAG: hypothetical protein IPJ19_01050 [Planctomycetes bacterium]|nr:hypothetical protein [Planctomycetota bacterium]
MSTHGVLVATDGDAVPDATGAPIPNFSFGGSSALGNNCVLDANGKVLFLARFLDSTTTLNTWDDKALFYGSSRNDLKLVIRAADQAPTFAPGVLLRTTSGLSSGISSSPRISPDGQFLWGSYLYDGGVNITAANDEAIFGGPLGNQTLLVQQNDVAPGTGGAQYAQAFSSPSQQYIGINREGRVYFQATLVNGTGVPPVNTTSGTNNQAGLWSGMPGNFELVARKSDPVDGMNGEVAIDTATSLGSVMQMNNSGQLLYEITLSNTQGSPMATVTNDKALMVHTPGQGSQVLVREGDNAPGTFDPNTSTFATFNAITGDGWSANVSSNCWTRDGVCFFASDLRGGDVIPGQNDRGLFMGGVGTLALIGRKNDPAPGTTGFFTNWNTSSLLENASGQICLQGILGGATTADDTGIWAGAPNALQLVLREGDVLPGTGGSIAGSLSGTGIYFNDRGQVLFNVTLSGGTVTGGSLWAWDPVLGLMPVILNGDQVEITPGVFMTCSGSFGGVSFNNTDGASLHFSQDGRIGLRVGFVGGTNAIMTLALPSGVPNAFCFGDGSQFEPCPCGNSGAAGRGCENSASTGGALLSASGSIQPDSIVLTSSGELPHSFSIFLQGDARTLTPFGDGLRCAGGTLKRLYNASAVSGVVSAPNLAGGDPSITLRSAALGDPIAPGDARFYQVYYRDPSASFCPAPAGSTFNISNAIEIFWQ